MFLLYYLLKEANFWGFNHAKFFGEIPRWVIDDVIDNAFGEAIDDDIDGSFALLWFLLLFFAFSSHFPYHSYMYIILFFFYNVIYPFRYGMVYLLQKFICWINLLHCNI